MQLYQYTKGDPIIFQEYMGVGEAIEPDCGDVLRVYIATKREIITEIGYTINESSCQTAKVCGAVACELAKDKPVMEAYLIKAADIAAKIGDLPQSGMHCAQMAELSLKRALVDYAKNRAAKADVPK